MTETTPARVRARVRPSDEPRPPELTPTIISCPTCSRRLIASTRSAPHDGAYKKWRLLLFPSNLVYKAASHKARPLRR